MIICPAVTSVSLFASAISFPALIASIVGRIPIIPTIAVTTICESFQDAAASNPSIPDKISTSRSAVFIFSSAAFSSDMSTTKPVEEALSLFGELIGEMEELMKD